jgi:hypothetical protein
MAKPRRRKKRRASAKKRKHVRTSNPAPKRRRRRAYARKANPAPKRRRRARRRNPASVTGLKHLAIIAGVAVAADLVGGFATKKIGDMASLSPDVRRLARIAAGAAVGYFGGDSPIAVGAAVGLAVPPVRGFALDYLPQSVTSQIGAVEEVPALGAVESYQLGALMDSEIGAIEADGYPVGY